MADNIFDIEIITPDRVFYKGETDFLEFNTQNGEIGVYKNHIPLTTVLAPGIVTIHNGDEEKIAAIHSGFAEILGDKVTFLAELAEWPDEIDIDRAQAAKERAEQRLSNHTAEIDVKRAEFAYVIIKSRNLQVSGFPGFLQFVKIADIMRIFYGKFR